MARTLDLTRCTLAIAALALRATVASVFLRDESYMIWCSSSVMITVDFGTSKLRVTGSVGASFFTGHTGTLCFFVVSVNNAGSNSLARLLRDLHGRNCRLIARDVNKKSARALLVTPTSVGTSTPDTR
jgi:hypothetical protein